MKVFENRQEGKKGERNESREGGKVRPKRIPNKQPEIYA